VSTRVMHHEATSRAAKYGANILTFCDKQKLVDAENNVFRHHS